MHERRATGYCERCAQRLDLLIPEPGSDLELRRIEDLIRFCAGCGRYVGRACCWRAEEVACADCAERAVSASTDGGTATDAVARGAMRILAEAPTELAEVEAHAAASAKDADRDRAIDAWEDAWLEAGALSARVESAGGTVTKRVQEPLAVPGAATDQPRVQLRRLMQASAARREAAVRALSQAGARIASRFEEAVAPAVRAPSRAGTRAATRLEERGARPRAQAAPARRRRPIRILTGVLVIMLLVAIGVATIGELQQLGTGPGATPLPGSPADGASGSPFEASPTAGSGAQTVAEAGFDLRVLGPLTVEPPIVRVEGSAEVLAFPTPFDRSLRLAGPELSGFCVDASTLGDAPVSAAFDVLRPSEAAPASLALTFATSIETRETFELGPDLMAGLQPDTWYRVTMTWEQGGSPLTKIQPRDESGDELESRPQSAPEPTTVDDEEICVWLVADARGQSILLDNLGINQS